MWSNKEHLYGMLSRFEPSTIVLLLLLQKGQTGRLDLDRGGGRDAARGGGRPGVGEVAVLEQPQHLCRGGAALGSL